ncbi:hypothetical protein D3C83_241070 [compost metagenome]
MSSRVSRREITSMPSSPASSITEARVMPVSAEVSTGSKSLPSLTMKMFSPAPSAT